MKTLIVLVCLVVLVHSKSTFLNGKCIRDPNHSNLMEADAPNILGSNYLLRKFENVLETISRQIEALQLDEHNQNVKSEVNRQIAVAKDFDTRLKGIKCELIDERLEDSTLKDEFRLQYGAIFVHMKILSEKLNSLIAHVNSIKI